MKLSKNSWKKVELFVPRGTKIPKRLYWQKEINNTCRHMTTMTKCRVAVSDLLKLGFNEVAWWALYQHICEKTIGPLKWMIRRPCGHPMDLTPKQWDHILKEILWSMEIDLKDCEKYPEDDKEREAYFERRSKAYENFGKYFRNLWT